MAESAVIVVPHAVAMSSGIMDNNQIAHVDFRQLALDGKFIAVFAKRTNYVIYMVFGCICLPKNSNVMVSPVHAGRIRSAMHASTPI